MPSTRKVQSAVSTFGVGPAVRTGNPDSTYWPGGSRSASSSGTRRWPPKPREMKPFMAGAMLAAPGSPEEAVRMGS